MLLLAALSCLYRQVGSQRSFHFLGQLLKYKVVRLAQQSLQFFVSENAESLKRDPLIARHVRRGIYSLLFNQLDEFLQFAREPLPLLWLPISRRRLMT